MVSSPGRTPRRLVTALAVLLAGLIAAPAPASASSEQTFPVDGAEFQRARDIAQAHWGTAPCQGNLTFTWQGLEPLTNARATWSNPTDAWNNVGENFDCSVVFNALVQYDFAMLCTVMAHELGHLLGHTHVEQAGLLMSPIYTSPLPECGGSATSTAEPDHADDTDPVASTASQPASRAKSLKTPTRKSTRRKRCVVRFKAGKRVRRCVALKKTHVTRKARTAAARPRVHHYIAR